ncbi:MAG: ABC transporter permease [candidate division NC10 bacterium]|nr:ABC transporter permease [candidate division NC10 bacterium]
MKVMDAPVYDSARRQPPMFEELFDIVRYRDLVVQLVRRDIVTRYKRSVFGVAWTMLQPLAMMMVLTIAFSQVLGTTRSYAAYTLSGLVFWQFFAQTTMMASRQLIAGGSLLHRIYIPKTLFAFSAIGTGLIHMLLSLIPMGVVMVATGTPLRLTALLLPVPILFLVAFSLGIGLLISAGAAYFPDVNEIYEIVLSAWMYLTPIIYQEDIIPESARFFVLTLNPMHHLLRLFRLILYQGVWPSSTQLASAVVAAFTTLAIGWIVFTRKANELAYRV